MAFAAVRQTARAGLSPRAAPFACLAAAAARHHRHFSSYLVTPKELSDALEKNASPSNSSSSTLPRVVPLCASWFLPNDERTGIQTFREQRIPRARFFDLDKVIDKHSPYPHMLPSAKVFAAAMSELGIHREDAVVVYDTHELGIFSAPRVGWTLSVFGHPRVHVLNNFRLWVQNGYPTESGELYSVECCPYPIPELDASRVASFEHIKAVALGEHETDTQILDARSAERFAGTAPEPRKGLSSGHMPHSTSLPLSDLLDPNTKAYLSPERLRAILAEKGVDPAKPTISTCGTGVTACAIETALQVTNYGSRESRKVYDGSWTEWAQRVQPSEKLIIQSK